jgi:hypothetical protein
VGLFLDMDAAVTRELDRDELGNIDGLTLLRIIEICARVAGDFAEPGITPRPPASQHIRVELIIPDDFVWRSDLSFDQVEAVTRGPDEYVIVYRGGRTTIHTPGEHLRVAVSPSKAQRWNEERVFMGEDTLRNVAENYGT